MSIEEQRVDSALSMLTRHEVGGCSAIEQLLSVLVLRVMDRVSLASKVEVVNLLAQIGVYCVQGAAIYGLSSEVVLELLHDTLRFELRGTLLDLNLWLSGLFLLKFLLHLIKVFLVGYLNNVLHFSLLLLHLVLQLVHRSHHVTQTSVSGFHGILASFTDSS